MHGDIDFSHCPSGSRTMWERDIHPTASHLSKDNMKSQLLVIESIAQSKLKSGDARAAR